MSLSKADAALRIGMKPSEVIAVQPVPGGGYDVTTHDRQVVRVGMGGTGTTVELGVKDVTDLVRSGGLVLVGEKGPEAVSGTVVVVPPELGAALRGPAKDVLAWVAGDPERAALAHAAEKSREQPPPRVTLLADLEKLIKDAESS